MTKLAIKFGAQIRDRRRELGLTHRELASAAGVSSAYVSMLENGRSNPTLGTIEAVAEALGLSVSVAPAGHADDIDPQLSVVLQLWPSLPDVVKQSFVLTAQTMADNHDVDGKMKASTPDGMSRK